MAKTTRAMEDMLASIRQAIHEESAYQSAGLHAPVRETPRTDEPQGSTPARLAPANDDAGAADFLRPLRPSRHDEDEEWSDDLAAQEPPAGLTDSHTLSGHRRIISGVMGGGMDVDEAMERLGAPAPAPVSAFADPEFEQETRADRAVEGVEDEGGSWWPDRDDFPTSEEDMAAQEPQTEAPAAREAALAPLISPQAEAAAASAFSRLTQEVAGRAPSAEEMEALTREMLKPMLRDWLDANLPDLVERLVREEIARIARGGRGGKG